MQNTNVAYDSKVEGEIIVTQADAVINWIRKHSVWPMPMGLACCAIELMAAGASRFDISRFGMEVMRFSPRQADCMIVSGTVTYKMAEVIRRIYEQMAEPKWVIAFGACASSGGFYQNYSVLQGIDRLIPVDIYIAGCPPRPEAVLDGLMELQDRIQNDGPTVESKMINPQAIRHQEAKIEQLDHYFRIPKKEVLENTQNPKSNRSIKPGFTYNQDQANVSPNMGYDTPSGFQEKEALREE